MMLACFKLFILCFLLLLVSGVVLTLKKHRVIEKFFVVQYMGTVMVALFVLSAGLSWSNDQGQASGYLIDCALSAAILAVITLAVFTQKLWAKTS